MSNWANVLLCWSGIDHEVPNDKVRFVEVTKAFEKLTGRHAGNWTPLWSCSHDDSMPSSGAACEFVAHVHDNHFNPETLLAILAEFKWEYPQYVQVISKDENDKSYIIRTLSEQNFEDLAKQLKMWRNLPEASY